MATVHVAPTEAFAHVLGKGADQARDSHQVDEEAHRDEAETVTLTTASSPGNPATKGEQPRMTSRFDTVDGLRGIGCLLVVTYHLRMGVQSAWVCIGLFFTLSGLLMTTIALQAQAKHCDFSVFIFWKRRVARLIPALMLVVVSISCKTLVQRAITGEPGPTELYYLRKDLLWTIAYGQNWNMISQAQDYFADTKKPSVVRHVWSLSIEEQYYILWPLVFVSIARLATIKTASKGRESNVPGLDPAMCSSMFKPEMRLLLKLLLGFEIVAILFSQYICNYVFRTQGGSAAYFASWTRAGEFAVGGLVSCCLHLSSWSYEKLSRSPGRPPMSTLVRVALEVASGVTIVSILGCSMIPLPQDVLMEHYIHWLRLPMTLVITFGGGAQLLQTSEPLPPWAIFTKLTGSRLLVYFGIVSYGLYLTHWVLIVWFGDSEINTVHSITTWQGRQAGMMWRDVAIGFVSIVLSTASFWLFEKPLVQRSAKARAGRVIASGMVSMGCVAMLALVATRGCVEPTADALTAAALTSNVGFDKLDKLGMKPSAPAPTTLMFLGDSQADRLAYLMQMINDKDRYRCPASYAGSWGPKVINHGEPGGCLIQQFGTERCTMCSKPTTHKSEVSYKAKGIIEKEQAPYVFVMDSNFFRGWETAPKHMPGRQVRLYGMELPLQEALQRMIIHLAVNGARHIFLSPSSPYIEFENLSRVQNGALVQTGVFRKAVGTLRCRSSTDAGLRVLVSIVDYPRLVCPHFDERLAAKSKKRRICDQSGPGFRKKMDDYNFHANTGAGGMYLVRQLQEVLYSGIARQGAHFAKPFAGPVGCRQPNERVASPGKLLSTTEICLKRPRPPVAEMLLQHQGAKVEMTGGGTDVYMCRGFKMEGLEEGTGISSLSIIKDPETWHRIHHVILFTCDPSFAPPANFEESVPCTHEPFWDGCSRMVMPFTLTNNAASKFALPEGYAFRFLSKYALVQVHYKRYAAPVDETFLDSTGVRINLDRDLQPAQLFELGPRTAYQLSIPPRSRRHVVQSICAPECLSDAMEANGVEEFRIIAAAKHMHLAGIAIKSEVLHANGSSTPFAVDPSYNITHATFLPYNVVVSRGDALKVTCVYDTSQRASWTVNGISIKDEMCFSYIVIAQAPAFFHRCWHSGPDQQMFPSAGSAQSAECSSECSKPFSVQPTRHFQGPEAAGAERDVFSAMGACLK